MSAYTHHRYQEVDELDSSLSTIVMLIVLFTVIALSYLYTSYYHPQIDRTIEESSQANVINIEVASRPETLYPEPGSLVDF